MGGTAEILIVSGDATRHEVLKGALVAEGHNARGVVTGEDALRAFREGQVDVVILALDLPTLGGMEVLRQMHSDDPSVPIIAIGDESIPRKIVEVMQRGACDFMPANASAEDILAALGRALEKRRLALDSQGLAQEVEDGTSDELVFGRNARMRAILDLVKRVAGSDSTVLIIGESGTGKELIARAVHRHSQRKDREFVAVDCGSIVETLFESEVFGHVRGAFTDAVSARMGKLEQANEGTIFFDEISNLTLATQSKLLRAIQERQVVRVGANKPMNVDVRIVAASNRDLAKCASEGKFRNDLFYRLSVVPINIPPLRERREDIPLLVEHFIRKYGVLRGKRIEGISDSAMSALTGYDWPGNVRELENTIERGLVLCRGRQIEIRDILYITTATGAASHGHPGDTAPLAEIEKAHIERVMDASSWNVSSAARLLGINRKTLSAKIRKYGIEKLGRQS
jgi:DNA-binding NtrC family response regulator